MGKRHENDARMKMSAAWHTAAFTRSKRLPPFHRIVGDTERAARSPEEIVAALKIKFGAKPNG